MALHQRNYVEASDRSQAALAFFQELGEEESKADLYFQLGLITQKQQQWAKAEQWFRESLVINEQHSNTLKAARDCNQLAIVAQSAGRLEEAAGWLRRILRLPDLPSSDEAMYNNNLAELLKNEVRSGSVPQERLIEARNRAERALAIKETLGTAANIWMGLGTLAEIAEMEGRIEATRIYRRRERESFAAFAGNRYHINAQFGELIATIVAVIRADDSNGWAKVEASLSQLEANGFQGAAALRRIRAGERDWHTLVEDVDRSSALLVLRVLETLAEPLVTT